MRGTSLGRFPATRRGLLAGISRYGLPAACVLVLATGTAQAQSDLPTGGAVASGSASIATGAASVTVTQTSNRAIVNWSSFDVGSGNSVVFAQPTAGSATLNRVTGTAGSTIAGTITSNGAVYLVNPNGIAITATGTVRTGGGFVASTLDITDADFSAGKLAFVGQGASKGISNAGSITAGAGGYVALLGGTVANSGTISVPLGRIALGSGEALTLDLNGDSFLQVAVPSAVAGTLIDASGTLTASGGRIELKAASARDAVRNVVNMSGALSADSATGNAGSIVLLGGDGGTVTVSGTLSARADGAAGNGGSIETSGKTVDFTGIKVDTRAAHGTTGTWLVDPDDLIVDAAAAANIVTALGSSNVTLQTTSTTAATSPGGLVTPTPGGAGDITINAAITWGSANTLSLLAYNNIALNAAITGTAGGLTLTAGNGASLTGAITAPGAVNVGTFNLTNGNWTQNAAGLPAFSATDFRVNTANATFLRVIGGDGSTGTPYQISDLYGLQGIGSGGLAALNYVLANNIDASATAAWNAGVGFNPIGELSNSGQSGFTGSFNGQNHVITGLTINDPTRALYFGLFGLAANATISNIGLVGVNITARDAGGIGALAGESDGGSITNAYSTGTVSVSAGSSYGGGHVGGLVGSLFGPLSNSYSTANVSGLGSVGGLVGGQSNSLGTLTNVYATGTVSGTLNYVGGLVGQGGGASITNAYATGNVTSSANYVGGLVGVFGPATMTNAYATGTVMGGASSTLVGGLIGRLSSGTVTGVYATGATTGSGSVGGLVGYQAGGTIDGAYATGVVSGAAGTSGGLIGQQLVGPTNSRSNLNNAYWDTYTTTRVAAIGSAAGMSSNVGAVTSDPSQAGAANYAYKASAYANLAAAAGVGSATPTGFAFVAGNSTRPFLAFEVPTAAVAGVDGSGNVLIVTSHQLQLVGYNAATNAASYALSRSINLAETGAVTVGTPASYAGMWSGAGFVSLGTDGAGLTWDGSTYKSIGTITSGTYGFSGTLNGGGFTLSNLFVKRASANNTGLIGTLSGTLRNLTVSGTVTGGNGTGGVVGMMIGGPTTSTTGLSPVVSNVASAVNVTGLQVVGGLVGSAGQRSTVSNGTASGTVNGTNTVGGLIGSANRTVVTGSASGAVSGQSYIGGLIGQQFAGTTTGFATGSVTGTLAVGGLIGVLDGTATERGTATATRAAQANISGPSTTDRNFGRVTAYGTATTQPSQ